jgi:hypothetical protein
VRWEEKIIKIIAKRINVPQERQKIVTQPGYVQLKGNRIWVSSGPAEMFVPLTHSMRRSSDLP